MFTSKAQNVAPFVMDILFEKDLMLSEASKPAGNEYPTFDCAVLYRSEDSVCLLVLELKFNHPKGSGVKQILDKKYIARARKTLEERNKVVIDSERAVSLNLVISPSQEVNIQVEHV